MKLLLDTHTMLWWADEPNRLSTTAAAALSDSSNEVLMSVATPWEIQIKIRSGKLTLPRSPRTIIRDLHRINGVRILPIRLRHIYALDGIPDHHRDPFDRILIAQAVRDGMTLVTRDAHIARYPVPILW